MRSKFKFEVRSTSEFVDDTIFTAIKDTDLDSYVVAWNEENGEIDARIYTSSVVERYLDGGQWFKVM